MESVMEVRYTSDDPNRDLRQVHMHLHMHLHWLLHLHCRLHTCIAGCGSKYLASSNPGDCTSAGGPDYAPAALHQAEEGIGQSNSSLEKGLEDDLNRDLRRKTGHAPVGRPGAGGPAPGRRGTTLPPLGATSSITLPYSDHVEMATGVTPAHAHAPAHAPAPAPHLHCRMWIDTPGRTSGGG
jgi:hypothetical protein